MRRWSSSRNVAQEGAVLALLPATEKDDGQTGSWRLWRAGSVLGNAVLVRGAKGSDQLQENNAVNVIRHCYLHAIGRL
jgi:hypothetical protein